MRKVSLTICAGEPLFSSFFGANEQRILTETYSWTRSSDRLVTPELRRLLAESEGLITTWDSPSFGSDLLEIAPRMRVIAHCGGEVKARFEPSLFDALTVTNSPLPMARSTAELGAAFLLYCARNVDFYREALRQPGDHIYAQRHDRGSLAETLAGREVSMIGFGRVGRALVELLRGFAIRWRVYDPYLELSVAQLYSLRQDSLESVLTHGDLLVLTAALTPETLNLLDGEKLRLLPDGAVIINVARGGLIELNALTSEVATGRLRCALDVTDPLEPLPDDHPLRSMPGAIITPHIAASGRDVRRAIAHTVLSDLDRFFGEQPVKNRVTRTMLERMT